MYWSSTYSTCGDNKGVNCLERAIRKQRYRKELKSWSEYIRLHSVVIGAEKKEEFWRHCLQMHLSINILQMWAVSQADVASSRPEEWGFDNQSNLHVYLHLRERCSQPEHCLKSFIFSPAALTSVTNWPLYRFWMFCFSLRANVLLLYISFLSIVYFLLNYCISPP